MITLEEVYKGNDPEEIKRWTDILNNNCPKCSKSFKDNHTLTMKGQEPDTEY